MMSGLFSGNRTNKMSDIYYTLINIFGYKQSFSSCTSILIYIIRKTCWVFLYQKLDTITYSRFDDRHHYFFIFGQRRA